MFYLEIGSFKRSTSQIIGHFVEVTAGESVEIRDKICNCGWSMFRENTLKMKKKFLRKSIN